VHNGDVNLPFVSFSRNCISDLDNVSAWMEWVPLLNIGGECDGGVYGLVETHAVHEAQIKLLYLVCDKIYTLFTQINDSLAHKLNLLHVFNLTCMLL
jgi:hypothetical protein